MAGIALLGGAAALLVRRPALVPVVVLVAAPCGRRSRSTARTLLRLGGDGRPARAPAAALLRARRGRARARLAGAARPEGPRPLPRELALPAAAFFAFAFLSLLWADDIEAGANLLTFFTLPFAALLAIVAPPSTPTGRRGPGNRGIGLASLFAAVGIWQAITHELFFYAPNLAVSNANTDFFRVTSLFGDPSLYGRHVILGIGLVLVLLATWRSRPGS